MAIDAIAAEIFQSGLASIAMRRAAPPLSHLVLKKMVDW